MVSSAFMPEHDIGDYLGLCIVGPSFLLQGVVVMTLAKCFVFGHVDPLGR